MAGCSDPVTFITLRSFDVHLRSNGRFFAPKFPAKATWELKEGSVLFIDWGKFGARFSSDLSSTRLSQRMRSIPARPQRPTSDPPSPGKYEIKMDVAAKTGSGSAQGKPESWRKMAMKRPFNAAELALFDSEWSFIHPGG